LIINAKKWIKLAILSASLSALSACGFTLRGSQALPESFTQVAISAPLQFSPLSRALQRRLPVYQLTGVINESANESAIVDNNMQEQTVIVQLQPEQFERRLLSVFSTGQVAEYDLVYTVNYQVIFPNRVPIENTLAVSREYQDDPDQILAKSRELNLVLNELREESADRIIRLLSSQYNSSIIDNNATTSKEKSPLLLIKKGD
jgi:LPS-assembly lipoprotein